MFKKILDFMASPIEALKRQAVKRFLPSIFEVLRGYVDKYIPYGPIKMYAHLKLHRLNDFSRELVKDPSDKRGVVKSYLKTHKVELIREQVELINAIKADLINDPELYEILQETTEKLSKYFIKKRIQS
jgi:hypothetical protein